jgi:hypothetical protein
MNQVDWNKLISLQYWVEGIAGNTAVTPVLESGGFFLYFFVTVFSVLFSTGIILLVLPNFVNKNNPLVPKFNFWGNNFLWMGISGLFWLLLRQIEVGFLGSRIWLLVGLIWFLVIIGFIIRYFTSIFDLEYSYYKKNKSTIR